MLRQAGVVIGKPTHFCTFLSAVRLGDLLYDAPSIAAGYDLAILSLGTHTADLCLPGMEATPLPEINPPASSDRFRERQVHQAGTGTLIVLRPDR
jgi:hypothetical protein